MSVQQQLIDLIDTGERNGIRLIKALSRRSKKVLGYKTFPERVNYRHSIARSYSHKFPFINTVEMHAEDPLEKWQDVAHWQQKLSNKYNAREFARKFDCKLPELYFFGREIDSFEFSSLPDKYVIKPIQGHSSKGIYLMNNQINKFSEEFLAVDNLKQMISKNISEDPNYKVIIEEYLSNKDGSGPIPDDYKIYTFNGHIACIQHKKRIPQEGTLALYYDENWSLLPNIKSSNRKGQYCPPPDCLDEMVDKAKILSKAYKRFVRIDFYATPKGAVFGEFASYPAMGEGFTFFGIEYLTSYWDKYCKGMI